jgi:pimeloyl-ACP methyl ester carboxylesterase
MFPTTRADVGDVSLELIEAGDGPTLLFLHGEDGLRWSGPVLEALSDQFRVYAPHHPGWGGTTRPPYVTDVGDLAGVYAEYVEEHLPHPVVVVGCSFGGWVAAQLAVVTRAELRGLVLVAPTGVKLGAREERDYADIYMAAFDEIPEILYGEAARAPDLTDLSDDDYLYLATAQEATARYCWKPYMHDPKLPHWLRRIHAPTMLVHGARDHFALLPEFYERYAALIGKDGARVEQLDGIGHRVEEEAPARLAVTPGV